MNTRFKATKNPVERYRLQFETREGFKEACRRIGADGYLVFRSDGTLVGRLVRFNEQEMIVEVDASRDPDSPERPAPEEQERQRSDRQLRSILSGGLAGLFSSPPARPKTRRGG